MAHDKKTQPNIKLKNTGVFRHDLFKAEVAEMKKNVSYKKFQPRIEPVVHTHFFHTIDLHGNAQEYTVPVGGHFHKVKVSVDDKGNLKAECGPALRKIGEKTRSGKYTTSVKPVHYEGDTEGQFIADDHTHAMTYLYSQVINQEEVAAQRERDARAISAMKAGVSTAPVGVTDVEMTE